MNMPKKSKLADRVAAREAASAPAPVAAAAPVALVAETAKRKVPVPPSRSGKRAMTVHVSPEAFLQLKQLVAEGEAFRSLDDERVSVDSLLREAINLLFEAKGKPQIA